MSLLTRIVFRVSEKIASQTPDLITIPLELEINKRLNITALYLDNQINQYYQQ
jgi:hypothetical protein